MTTCFCSWSGGKDSCFALYRALQMGYLPRVLLTMCIENGKRSRSHGLSLLILKAQADALKLPLVTQSTSWSNYRKNFITKLTELKQEFSDLSFGIFGDIEENTHWEKELCTEIGFEAVLPLWKIDRKMAIHDFLNTGFQAVIVAVNAEKLEPYFLGKVINVSLMLEFDKLGIDLCGENGEYHTVVVDGPLFRKPLYLAKCGEPILRSGYWFQDFDLE